VTSEGQFTSDANPQTTAQPQNMQGKDCMSWAQDKFKSTGFQIEKQIYPASFADSKPDAPFAGQIGSTTVATATPCPFALLLWRKRASETVNSFHLCAKIEK
jgi:hypothetical protein